MSSNNQRHETLSILLDQAFVSGGNFLTSLVLARTLMPSAYGRFSLVLLFLYAINTCHSSVVVYPLILRAANGTQRDLATATVSSLVQTVLLAVPLALICVVFCMVSGEVRLAAGLVLAMVAWQLQETTRRALLASRNASKAVLPDLFCFVGQGVVLLLLKPQGVGAILAVIVGTSLLALLWQATTLRLTQASVSREMLERDARAAWIQGRHILGGNAFNMVALQLPSWTLAFFAGPVAVAGYQSLMNLAGIANPIIFSVNTALIPTVARSANQGYVAARKTALRVGLQYGALLLPCFLALGFAPAFVMSHLYGKATPYLHLAGLLPIFITAYAIQYVATVIGAYEGGMSRPQTYFRVQSLSTVALALLAIPLVRHDGVRGAIFAVLGFSIFRLISFALFSFHLDRKASVAAGPQSVPTSSASQTPVTVAVCLLSYKRTEMLKKTLLSLLSQSVLTSGECRMIVIVVDNDAAQSARDTVEQVFAGSGVPVTYLSNPANGLATGRNIAMDSAGSADYIAFIDDDEVASEDWLEQMVRRAADSGASVVTGPVDPILDGAPSWIQRGGFFAPLHRASGTPVPHVASNNTLVRKDVFTSFRFDRHFDRTGGEDTDFFLRVCNAGHTMVWCDEARVREWIPTSRANERWIVGRAQSDANRFTLAYLRLHGGFAARSLRAIKAAGGFGLGLVSLPLSVAAQHHRVRSLALMARAAGTLSALYGTSREDYAGDTSAPENPSAKVGKTAVVVVGQTPPPLNGQTIMIREFVQGTYDNIDITYVPMRFSRTASEVGRLDWRKPFLLFSTIAGIYRARWQSGAKVLYYPPAGANLVPVLRDMVLLIACRALFRKTVFHFHAAGLSQIYPRLPRLLRPVFRLAYDAPDLAIFTTAATSHEATFLKARQTAIVPCGVADPLASQGGALTALAGTHILFAGIVCEGKGVMTLLQACATLMEEGVPFTVAVMGAFQSEAFKTKVTDFVVQHGMQERVKFLGVLSGADKEAAFANADVFCFPSHYPAESFGVVLIEAMSHGLPIVATDWQGIPEVTGRDGRGTILVPVESPKQLALALATLLQAPARRNAMGVHNRARYLHRYTLAKYRSGLATCLAGLQPSKC